MLRLARVEAQVRLRSRSVVATPSEAGGVDLLTQTKWYISAPRSGCSGGPNPKTTMFQWPQVLMLRRQRAILQRFRAIVLRRFHLLTLW